MEETRSRLVVAPMAWRTARLSILLVFDVTKISRGEGDLLEPLILTAILQANQASLLKDPGSQLRYNEADWAYPDEQRRPISVHAVAQSLGLPFETVRRRTQALALRGACVATPAGVYVPEAAVTSPAYFDILARRVGRLAALHRELVAAGLQPPNPDLDDLLATQVRVADRLLGDYMLRACGDLLRLTGGAMDAVVLLALCAGNIRDLDVTEVGDWASYGDLARPCTATTAADELGMANETVRRHLHRLTSRGFCQRAAGGWIAAAPAASRPLLGALVNENAQNLRRMFAGLGELSARARRGVEQQRL